MDRIVDTWRSERVERRRGLRALLVLVAVVGVVTFVWLGGALAGLLPLSSGNIYTQWSNRPENLKGISGWYQDWTLGTDLFYLRAGDRIYIEYDATVTEGGFRVYVYDILDPAITAIVSRKFTQSDKGRAEAVVPHAGFYRFSHYGTTNVTPHTGGYEVSAWIAWGLVR